MSTPYLTTPYRQPTVLPPQPYHFRRRLVVYALTLTSLLLLLLFVLLSGALPFAACSAAVDRYLLVAAARFRAAGARAQ